MPDLREYREVGNGGLPRFHVGLIFSINGQRCEVIRVVSTFANPARVLVEVDPCPHRERNAETEGVLPAPKKEPVPCPGFSFP